MDKRTLHGIYFALSAYTFWGVVPIYFKWLAHVPPLEILAHRVIWSVILLTGILAITGKLASLRVSGKVLLTLMLSAVLLSINWLIYIYAIVNDRIVEASLGYYINPLFSVALGIIFMKEHLRPVQWLAVGIAAFGISLQIVIFGEVPLIALGLAISFGLYGLIRKNLNLPSVVGLTLETMSLAPLALAAICWFIYTSENNFLEVDLTTDLLLIVSGVVTSFPLLCFAAAVTRLPLSTAGMFQYIGPSLSLVIAVFYYHEAFGIDRVITFVCIWLALVIYTLETFYQQRKLRWLLSDSPQRL